MDSLFPSDFLKERIKKLRLGRNLHDEKEIIEHWIDDLESGKLKSSKEESIKSKYIQEIFGDVLGYNYGNSNKWMLEEEYKSKTDATKCDAALGFFYPHKDGNDPRVVIEVKPVGTELDKRQRGRKPDNSPVDQAFLYVSKQGEKCRWIVVTNFEEIRFYHYSSQDKFQIYALKELRDYKTLKEFIFLFHRDFLITNQSNSKTEALLKIKNQQIRLDKKRNHILDLLYNSLIRFEGFEFIDPRFISNISPFNILTDHVWHYDNWKLFTINPEIHRLLSSLEFRHNEIIVSKSLKVELEKEVDEYYEKLEYVFKTLFQSMIHEVIAVKDYKKIKERSKQTIGFSIKHQFSFKEGEGISKKIHFEIPKCDCVNCVHKDFDYTRLFEKLDIAIGDRKYMNFEYAYGFYLVSHRYYKTSYSLLKRIQEDYKNEIGKEIKFFLAKLNLNNIRNLLRGYDTDTEDQIEIKKFIDEIDLDYTISNEVEQHIESDVRKYLIEIKEFKLVSFISKKIDEVLDNIKKTKATIEKGTTFFSAPDNISELHFHYSLLHQFINRNFIMYDVFSDYKSIFYKVFEGLCFSYLTPNYGLSKFNSFYLTEAVLHLQSEEIKKAVKDINIIEIDEKDREIFVNKINNLLTSFYDKGIMNLPFSKGGEFLSVIDFKWTIERQISNAILLINKMNLKEDESLRIFHSFADLLTVENFLAHWTLTSFGKFISNNAKYLDYQLHLKILEFCINSEKKGNNKYDGLSKEVILSIKNNFDDLINDKSLIMRALSNISRHQSKSEFLVSLYLVSENDIRVILKQEFLTTLDNKFNSYLYELLLVEKIIDPDYLDYFGKYMESIEQNRGKGFVGFKNNHPQFEDFYFYNLVILLNKIGYDPNDLKFKILKDLSDYESWLFNPANFDYTKFRVEWVLVASHWTLRRIGNKQFVKRLIENKLKEDFNEKLSKIYINYFA